MKNIDVTFKTINQKAKETLKNNWSIAILASIIFVMIYSAPNQIVFNINASIYIILIVRIISFLLSPIEIGLNRVFLDFSEQKEANLDRLFFPFKKSRYLKSLGSILVRSIYIGLLLLLLIIPGIMYLYSTALVPVMLADERYDKLTIDDLLRVSKLYMKGFRFKLFLIELKYLWFIAFLFATSSALLQFNYEIQAYTLYGVTMLFYTFRTVPLMRQALIEFYQTVTIVDQINEESEVDFIVNKKQVEDPLALEDTDPFFR